MRNCYELTAHEENNHLKLKKCENQTSSKDLYISFPIIICLDYYFILHYVI